MPSNFAVVGSNPAGVPDKPGCWRGAGRAMGLSSSPGLFEGACWTIQHVEAALDRVRVRSGNGRPGIDWQRLASNPMVAGSNPAGGTI